MSVTKEHKTHRSRMFGALVARTIEYMDRGRLTRSAPGERASPIEV